MTDEILLFAGRLRRFLEPRWKDWQEERFGAPRIPLASGMCRFSALTAVPLLKSRFPGTWRVVGGTPDRDIGSDARTPAGKGGLRAPDGSWHGHYWTLGRHRGVDLIVDLTADQFGHESVVVTEASDPRYCRSLRHWAVRQHLIDVAERAILWAAAFEALEEERAPRANP